MEEAAWIDCKMIYQTDGLEKHSLWVCSEWMRADGGEGTVCLSETGRRRLQKQVHGDECFSLQSFTHTLTTATLDFHGLKCRLQLSQ